MAIGRHLRVRLLQPVTYGSDQPGWQVGDIKVVHESLARMMLLNMEAELVDSIGLDTSTAMGIVPLRVR